MKYIQLNTKEELNIYMNPVRQQLLRFLSIGQGPMTPKMLANKLSISPSSVQHHIKKLLSLGVIELDHTELINGITASFYKPAPVTVQIGLEKEDESLGERDACIQNSLSNVYQGFRTHMKERLIKEGRPEDLSKNTWGDILTGVLYLDREESKELLQLIRDYIEKHSHREEGRIPWEYGLILYDAGEIEEEKRKVNGDTKDLKDNAQKDIIQKDSTQKDSSQKDNAQDVKDESKNE